MLAIFASVLMVAGVVAAPAHGQSDGLVAGRRNLMPVPESVRFRGEALPIHREFAVSVDGPVGGVEPRVERAVVRMLERLALHTAIPIRARIETDRQQADLRVEYFQAVAEVQSAIEDEAYTLEVSPDQASLQAPTPYGVLRGLETFLQLVEVAGPVGGGSSGTPGPTGASGDVAWAEQRAATISELAPEPPDFIVPGVLIRDAPRFPWRGLLIDSGRHFFSLDVIKRNLDAMAAVKLNVLHWHLSEDQGFRVESKVFPKLHELGSDGLYYTQDEIGEVIEYARDRGIRVMPEFDMPGHATSWFVGYPELASAPGPYEIIETWGIKDPAMDPTRDQTYEFLAALIAEMAALFPDAYFHIGGDEVNGNQWGASDVIQEFIDANELGDNHGLQTYFNRRIQPFLAESNKTMMGWDEIFQPGLPQDAVVHSWRGPEGVAAAARAGYRTVLSNGYYIDLSQPAWEHYAVDPLGGPAAELNTEERELVLGGEATMWGEYVVDETVDSRIWPRTAAIAERLWSPASVIEVDDMYRRLDATSRWLETTGVTHRSNYEPMLARLAGDAPVAPLRVLADVVEPLKRYRRGRTRSYSRFTPLNRLVDAARPESDTAREFGNMVDEYTALVSASEGAGGYGAVAAAARRGGEPTPPDGASAASSRAELETALRRKLTTWRDNHEALVVVARGSTMLPEAEALSAQLAGAAEVGIAALDAIESGQALPTGNRASREQVLEAADEQHGALRIMIVEAVRRLLETAHEIGE